MNTMYITLDDAQLQADIQRLRDVLTPEQMNKAMYRAFQRTGSHVKTILRKDIPPKYEVRAGDVGAAVKRPHTTLSGGLGGASCVIPVVGPKRRIGADFKASGGAHGWNSRRRKYRVKSKIVKGQQSTLPANAGSYGGQPPFRNLGSKLMPQTFTRTSKKRLPIEKIVGIAIPQMPLNRSEGAVQADIKSYVSARIEHEVQHLIASGR